MRPLPSPRRTSHSSGAPSVTRACHRRASPPRSSACRAARSVSALRAACGSIIRSSASTGESHADPVARSTSQCPRPAIRSMSAAEGRGARRSRRTRRSCRSRRGSRGRPPAPARGPRRPGRPARPPPAPAAAPRRRGAAARCRGPPCPVGRALVGRAEVGEQLPHGPSEHRARVEGPRGVDQTGHLLTDLGDPALGVVAQRGTGRQGRGAGVGEQRPRRAGGASSSRGRRQGPASPAPAPHRSRLDSFAARAPTAPRRGTDRPRLSQQRRRHGRGSATSPEWGRSRGDRGPRRVVLHHLIVQP